MNVAIRSTATLRPSVTCDARTGVKPGEYGFENLWCNTRIGLRLMTDASGETRRYCAAPGHEEAVVARFGRGKPNVARAAQALGMGEPETRVLFDYGVLVEKDDPEDDCGHEAVLDIEPVHGILHGVCAGCGLTVSATGDEYEDGSPSWEPTDDQPSVYATEWRGHRVEVEVV